NVRESDAGVAGGALDDRAARLQDAAALGIQDDPLCSPILDRAARIHELRFPQDFAARLLAQAPQADQRGVADRIRKSISYIHQFDASSSGAISGTAPASSRFILSTSNSPVHFATTSVATPLPMTLV